MELIIHGLVVYSWRVTLMITVYIDTERPPDGVNGAVTRTYIGLAEYPLAPGASGDSASRIMIR